MLQVLALDIGTDLLPALALSAEPPNPRPMQGPARTGALMDAALLRRFFGSAFPRSRTTPSWTLTTQPEPSGRRSERPRPPS